MFHWCISHCMSSCRTIQALMQHAYVRRSFSHTHLAGLLQTVHCQQPAFACSFTWHVCTLCWPPQHPLVLLAQHAFPAHQTCCMQTVNSGVCCGTHFLCKDGVGKTGLILERARRVLATQPTRIAPASHCHKRKRRSRHLQLISLHAQEAKR